MSEIQSRRGSAGRGASGESARPSQLGRRAVLAAGLGGLGLALGACGITSEGGSAKAPGGAQPGGAAAPTSSGVTGTAASFTGANAAQTKQRATVPVLCYHQVRPWAGDDSAYTKGALVIPPEKFAAQLDGIKAAGYTTISPAQYTQHLLTGSGLPAKPVLLSFDDGKDNQVSQALPALVQRGMTGTFFIMTVILGNTGWITRDDVKRIADAGMTVGSHTWDHHMVTKYAGKDYATQLEEPRELLRKLSGQEVDDFAYPYGAWNPAILPHLTKAGYRTAYQLQEHPIDGTHPELTLRRVLAVSTWTGQEVVSKLESFT